MARVDDGSNVAADVDPDTVKYVVNWSIKSLLECFVAIIQKKPVHKLVLRNSMQQISVNLIHHFQRP